VELGKNREAIDCFRDLVRLTPHSSDAHFNLANLLADTGNVDESLVHYHLALELTPDFPAARENLGRTLTDTGRLEEAEQVWKDWLKREPDSAVARHMLASLSGKNVPKRCDDAYIRQTFDESFARNYDHQLARIQYKGPELVQDSIARLGRELADLDVLDAGCGTGLCGPIIRGVARRLVGVDLCDDMLAEAEKRGAYDETIAGEITEYMRSHLRAFDLIISSDTFCYFGELEEVLLAAYECLRDSGILIFTVESALAREEGEPYTIRPSGRYSHAESYLTESLNNIGFSILSLTHAVLRTERGVPVDGLVLTAGRRSQ
jgi:predicted TPR repeat methyltransferase